MVEKRPEQQPIEQLLIMTKTTIDSRSVCFPKDDSTPPNSNAVNEQEQEQEETQEWYPRHREENNRDVHEQ